MAEQKGLNRVLPGPGNWRKAEDPFYFKESFGQVLSFRSIRVTSHSAKLRVKYTYDRQRRQETSDQRTISIQAMADSLPNIYDASEQYHRKLMFKDWYDHSCASVLAKNEAELAHVHSIKVDDILLDIAGCPKPWDSAIYTR